LTTGTGNDKLLGGEGNDILFAGAGHDHLFGGGGNDVFTGGSGKDRFVIQSLSGIDTITDFNHGEDILVFAGPDFAAAQGIQRVDRFKLTSETLDADDRILYNPATGAVLYDPDGSGAAPAVQFATLSGAPALAFDDSYFAGTADLPVAFADTATTDEHSPVTINVLDNDYLPTDFRLNFAFVNGGAATGSVSISDEGSLLFTPGASFRSLATGQSGTATVNYQLWSSERTQMVTGTATVTVAGLNEPPLELSAIAGGSGGFVINGQHEKDGSGRSVAAIGDFNGDGLADLIVSAPWSDPAGGGSAGRSYVVFGRTGATAIDLSAVASGAGGFVINGEGARDYSGISVSGAGDINGDGLVDLVVGAPGNNAVGHDAGRSYVVFGRTGSAAVNLSSIAGGAGGFVVNGQSAGDKAGSSVAAAGDVNGDGLADLVIGAPDSDPAGGGSAGRSYVVLGRTGTAAVDLSAVAGGQGGFVINGQCAGGQSGWSVAGAGDVNGDGLGDLIVGAFLSATAAGSHAGRSYVVFGRTGSMAIDLAAVAAGSGGFVINGKSAGEGSGRSVAAAGDVNGDGLADLIVGAPWSGAAAGDEAGRSYVIFGHSNTTAVDLSAVANGSGGFAINGQSAGDQSGWSVAGAGDLNGDGLADMIIGAPWSDPATGNQAGRSYVVFGRTGTAAIDLSVVAGGSGGFAINGQSGGDQSGNSVAAGGDINGDGLADLVIGAHWADPAGGNFAGRSYVILGSTAGVFGETAVDQMGGAGNDYLMGTFGG
ncbi:MAG: Integrins alpha chain, partial [Rhodocyclaceae bacterium]